MHITFDPIPGVLPDEQIDLDHLKEAIIRAKLDTYDLMCAYNRMNTKELKNCGHKSADSAVLACLERGIRSINTLQMQYLQKWPDK